MALVSLVLLLSVPLDDAPHDDRITWVLASMGVLLTLFSMVMTRAMVAELSKPGVHDAEVARAVLPPVAVVPALVWLEGLPWMLSGTFSDERTSVAFVTTWLLVLAYCTILAGVLAAAMVLMPIELALRGAAALVNPQRRRQSLGLLAGAFYIGSVTVFAVSVSQIGGLNFSDSPRLSFVKLTLALLGIPGDYVVSNPAALWVARASGLVLVYVFVQFVRGLRSERRKAKGSPSAPGSESGAQAAPDQ